MYQERPVKLRMIGAGAVNQAIKALAIAQSMAKKPPNDLNLAYRFSFDTVEFDNGERSALVVDVLTL
jgi:stage V sporulation protein SpoVS